MDPAAQVYYSHDEQKLYMFNRSLHTMSLHYPSDTYVQKLHCHKISSQSVVLGCAEWSGTCVFVVKVVYAHIIQYS
jgi:hypothetical protein